MSQFRPKARQKDIVVQEFADEVLIYDLKVDKAYALNTTSSKVWQHCSGQNTVADIAFKLTSELKEFVSEDIVWLALNNLIKDNLLENKDEFSFPFESTSRRELIRRIGMSSLVALPVIASLVAPSSVYAFSCADANNNLSLNAIGCPCQSNNDCMNVCCGAVGSCVTAGSVAIGTVCQSNCECVNNCCGASLTCTTIASVGSGGPCRVNCECTSAMCVGLVCT